MARRLLSRRALLKGILGGAAVSIALPPLEAFFNTNGTAYAGGGPVPPRFGVFFWGNGSLSDRWTPAGTGPTWTPSPLLTPLAALVPNITVVSGTNVLTPNTTPHGSGPAGIFTGDSLQNGTFSRPSLDQVIASAIGGSTQFGSIQFGVQQSTSSYSYTGPNESNPPECSPATLFNRLFGPSFAGSGASSMPDPRNALRASVLDAVMDQSARLRQQLGVSDQQRLDQHLAGIRSLENRIQLLENAPPAPANCMRPPMPLAAYPDIMGRPQLSAVSRAMSDIVAMALACDQTRVFFDMFSQSVSNPLYPGATEGHHQLTHDEPGEQPTVFNILHYILTELAYLLTALKNIPEGDSTVLDNTLVLATTDVSFGRTHEIDNYPILLCGGAAGGIKQGIHYHSATGRNVSDVMLTVLQIMGVPAASFGVGPGLSTTPVHELLP